MDKNRGEINIIIKKLKLPLEPKKEKKMIFFYKRTFDN